MSNLVKNENEKIICSNCKAINNVNLVKAQNNNVKCAKCKFSLDLPKIRTESEIMNSFEYSINYLKEFFQKFYDCSVDYIGQEKCFEYSNKIRDLEQKIYSLKKDVLPLILVVAGEYSSGKSSFINSLIGEDLLPADFEPITLAPSFLRYGEEKKILIEFHDESFEEVSIEKFSSIKHSNDSLEEKYKENIKFIHILYPYPKLSKIHIIDTPGFSTATKKGDDEKTMEIINDYADLLLWVFDANNGTAEFSESGILDKIKGLFNKDDKNENAIKNNFLNSILNNTKKPIIGVVNKIDLKGKPDSISVKRIVEEVKKESNLDIIIPYSSKKIMDYKKVPPMNKISSLIEDKIKNNSNLNLNLNLKEDDRGNKTISIYNSSNELISMKIDFGEIWFDQLNELENNLDKTRNYSKEILKKSIDSEIDSISNSILNDINDILKEINFRKRKEKNTFEESIKNIKDYSKKIEENYNEYESGFKYNLSQTLAQNIFHINFNKGWITDDQSIELKNFNDLEIIKITRDSFNLKELTKIEIENVLSFFDNCFSNLKNKRLGYNNYINEIFENYKKTFESEIYVGLLYLYQSNTNAVSLSAIGLAQNIMDKYSAINSQTDPKVIYKVLFNHIYNDCSFNVLFYWLKSFIESEYISLKSEFENLDKVFENNNNNEISILNEIKNKLVGEFR